MLRKKQKLQEKLFITSHPSPSKSITASPTGQEEPAGAPGAPAMLRGTTPQGGKDDDHTHTGAEGVVKAPEEHTQTVVAPSARRRRRRRSRAAGLFRKGAVAPLSQE